MPAEGNERTREVRTDVLARVEGEGAMYVRLEGDEVADVQSSVDRLNYGRGFFETRPTVIECLKAMTGAFSDDERIWATSVIGIFPGIYSAARAA